MGMRSVEKERLKEIMNDPVKWAQAFLKTFDPVKKKIVPWTARWYQVEMLRDGSIKKVYRCGRRIGKCLPGHTRVYDPTTGERVPVKELYERGRAHLLTMDDNYKIQHHFTNEILDNGIKEVFKVTTKTGRSIDATANHPLFTALGWQAIEYLKPGDKVAIAGNMGFFGKHEMSENEIKLLAYMIGDGNYTTKAIRFCNPNKEIINELERAVNYFDCDLVQYNSGRDIDYNIVKKFNKSNNNYANPVKELLEKHDMFGQNAYQKKIPSDIFKLRKNDTALFLSRLYATDGWAHAQNNKQVIGYGSVSLELIKDMQHLLLKFGINSYINYKPDKRKEDGGNYHNLLITNSTDVIKFYKEIGIFAKEEAVKKAYLSAISNNKFDTYLPKEILEFVEADRINQGLSKADLCKNFKNKNTRFRMNYDIQRSRLKEFANVLDNEDLKAFADGEFIFDEIVSIESLGEMQTYDLSIPLTMNFVAEDFITHNTETMVVESLYHVFTKRNFRVLIVTPYENQVRLAFMRLNELISESPILKSRIVSNTKNPYIIKFNNDSAILGFTTGASSGSGGASIRGQRADLIIMDEVDYMSEADFDSVTAIAAERRDIRICMSSTPTGKRSQFWKACTDDKMGYKQHYHPSTHNPGWCEEMEAEFRAQLTESGYVHEVLAEFGTQETGVFDKEKLEKALTFEDYAYNELDYYQKKRCLDSGVTPAMYLFDRMNKAHPNTFRTMGVDWDKYGANSSIVITDYDMRLKKFKVLKRVEVPRSEYSYDNAVNIIVQLNEIYNPSFIYCDAGAGEYQIERLHIIGDENPSSGLKGKVKRWSFSNNLDIQNPVTGEMDKKPLKPFMINQLQIAFEREMIALSPYDEVIFKQLIDYEVEKRKQDGTPVFTSKNEHFIDALGLSYLAMVLEFKELTGIVEEYKTSTKVHVVKKSFGNAVGDAALQTDVRTNTNRAIRDFYQNTDFSDREGDRQKWVKVDYNYRSSGGMGRSTWGSRSATTKGFRR